METKKNCDSAAATHGASADASIWCLAATLIAPNENTPSGSPNSTAAPARGAKKDDEKGQENGQEKGGTKVFLTGSRVFILDATEPSFEILTVVGRHRKSRQYVKATVATSCLRIEELLEVSTPSVLSLAGKHVAAGGNQSTKGNAEALLQSLQSLPC